MKSKIPLGKVIRAALNLPDPKDTTYYYRGVAPYEGPVIGTHAATKERYLLERVELNLKLLSFRLLRTRHLYYQNGTKIRIKKKYTKKFEFYVGQDQEGNVYWCIGEPLKATRGW